MAFETVGDIEQTLLAAVSTERRRGRDLAVLLIDIDHFKQVNDTLDHKAGDMVLVDTGETIRAAAVRGFTRALGR